MTAESRRRRLTIFSLHQSLHQSLRIQGKTHDFDFCKGSDKWINKNIGPKKIKTKNIWDRKKNTPPGITCGKGQGAHGRWGGFQGRKKKSLYLPSFFVEFVFAS
jgi:hypothetical protein